jgi:hypothetical protein
MTVTFQNKERDNEISLSLPVIQITYGTLLDEEGKAVAVFDNWSERWHVAGKEGPPEGYSDIIIEEE